jgi:arylsulfatase A-like enzyme
MLAALGASLMTFRDLLFAFAVFGSLQSASHAAEQPNVIVILADDLGYGDLSCYGATDLRSPHIDFLISRGMKFVNFYANCPVCSPTRAALMTGKYPDRAGVPGVIRTHAENSWGYLDRTTTLADRFREAGYETAIVGKWHLGLESPNMPNERGFDLFRGFLGDMMDDYLTHRRHDINYMRQNGDEVDPTGHATDLFTAWACEFLESRKKDKPFFLYLAYNAPHVPIQPPAEWLAKVRQREPNISEKRAKLVALIEHLDDGVGKVMQALKQAGLEQNTLVVFTSDNGGDIGPGANNGPLRAGKGTVYEGGIKESTAVVWPNHVAAGSVTQFRAMTMDLYPTLLAAAGAPVEDDSLDGRSFLPTLLGEEQAALREEWYWGRREGGPFGGKTIEALRKGDWKLVWNNPFGKAELYNIADDPQEKNDMIAERPRIANELRDALMKRIQRGGEVPWQKPAE